MVMQMNYLSQRSAQNTKQKSGGKIRPGIKVLNKSSIGNSVAKEIYAKGVATRMKFTEIEKLIKEKTGIPNPLSPRNVPYYTVAKSDFGMPEVADRIIELYGEIRDGDPEKRLYRFPVVFYSDDLNVTYPNKFNRFGGEPNYESVYGENNVRYCQYLPEVTQEMVEEQRAKRFKRAPRREMVIRGECDPNICSEFLQGQCKFRGSLNFYIPGVPSLAPLVMETTSEYAAEAIYADLERLVLLYGGIPRSDPRNPGAPLFFITKVQEPRTYFENGVKKMGTQWVPKLQANVDIGGLLQNHEALRVTHTAPAAWLQAPKGMPDARVLPPAQQLSGPSVTGEVAAPESEQHVPSPEVQQAAAAGDNQAEKSEDDLLSDLETMIATAGVDEGTAADYFDLKLGIEWKEDRETILKAIGIMNDFASRNTVGVGSIMAISAKVAELELNPEDFGKYCFLKFGKGYRSDAKKLVAVYQHLHELSQSGKEMAQQFIKSTIADSTQAATAA